jgi:hypothetical protein
LRIGFMALVSTSARWPRRSASRSMAGSSRLQERLAAGEADLLHGRRSRSTSSRYAATSAAVM